MQWGGVGVLGGVKGGAEEDRKWEIHCNLLTTVHYISKEYM